MKFFSAILALCFLAPLSASSAAQTIVVSAAASLREALGEANAAFAEANPDIKIEVNLGGSGALQQQIEQGAPVDLFISAATKQIDALSAKNLLLEGTETQLLSNEVVLIGPPGATFPAGFADLLSPKVKHIAIGEPKSVPAGQYAQQIFAFFGIAEAIQPKLVFGKDVRMVLTYAETKNVDAGIVYRTDAKQSGKVTVLATAPPESHDPVIYPAAIIKSSKNSSAARTYLAFLKSAKAMEVFEKFGFSPAGP